MNEQNREDMLTWDERLMIGLKVLERLRPALRAQARAEASESHGAEANAPQEAPSAAPDNASELPSLEALLEQTGELSAYSAILGLCEDGLPFLLDLTNPAPGALLVVGDQQSGKTRLLSSLLASTCYLNLPDQVAFYLIVRYPQQYRLLGEADHCQALHAADASTLGELIEELAQTVEERRRSGPEEPIIILAIDDLHACLQALDEAAYSRLYWLIRHGPRSRVWTIAAYSTQDASRIDPRFLAAFRTRLMGSVQDRKLAAALSGDERLNTRRLQKGYEFCVPYGQEWSHFWICDSEATQEDETSEASNDDYAPQTFDESYVSEPLSQSYASKIPNENDDLNILPESDAPESPLADDRPEAPQAASAGEDDEYEYEDIETESYREVEDEEVEQ